MCGEIVLRKLMILIASVERSFEDMPREVLDSVFLFVQCSLEDCLRVDGDNTYHMRHIGKAKLRRQGILPVSLKVKPELILHGQHLLAVANGEVQPSAIPSPGAAATREIPFVADDEEDNDNHEEDPAVEFEEVA